MSNIEKYPKRLKVVQQIANNYGITPDFEKAADTLEEVRLYFESLLNKVKNLNEFERLIRSRSMLTNFVTALAGEGLIDKFTLDKALNWIVPIEPPIFLCVGTVYATSAEEENRLYNAFKEYMCNE